MNGLRDQVEKVRVSMEQSVSEFGTPMGLSLSSPEEVMDFVRKHRIESIRLWFTDFLGMLKAFAITPEEMESAFRDGMGFDGSSVEGYARIDESDLVARPVAQTAQIIPFRIGGARAIRMFANVVTPEGEPFLGDPRTVLKRSLARLEDYGLTHMNVGPEAEFFYLRGEKEPEIIDEAGYFDLMPVDIGDEVRELTVYALKAMGIQVEYHHHEVAPSQHEIDLKYNDALTMADNLQTYKWLVKEIARQAGVFATFMPKPLEGVNGSGMHVHLSLFNGEKNAFFDPGDRHHLSTMAKHFLAGALEHAGEMCLITNQYFNSYKRLVPGFEAPVYIGWAEQNRSALIRLPKYKPGKEEATRIELRFPDPTCNPYLTFSVMLGAGLKGVDRKMELSPPMEKDLYSLTEMQREEMNIGSLPPDLYAAVKMSQRSDLLKEVLGPDVLSKIVETKLKEVTAHRLHVSEFEQRLYLKY